MRNARVQMYTVVYTKCVGISVLVSCTSCTQYPMMRAYANGKSAVRVGVEAWPEGPHYFAGPPSVNYVSPDNPHGVWRAVVHPGLLVLHYAYTSPSEVAARAQRMRDVCGSPQAADVSAAADAASREVCAPLI